MKVSVHAIKRCQSRGIPADCREILERYGTRIRRPGGAEAYYLPKEVQRYALQECRRLYKALERAGNSMIVVSEDGTCLTAYKVPKTMVK